MSKKIGIIGAGVVGTAVGVVLNQKGYEITGAYDIKIRIYKTACGADRVYSIPHLKKFSLGRNIVYYNK